MPRRFKKEHEVLLLPLGGSTLINRRQGTLIQLQELTRITSKVAAVIDSERSTASSPLPRERQAFAEACSSIGIRAHILERRALENYFPQRAIDSALGSGHPELGEFGAHLSWAKQDNWRISNELLEAELLNTDLGSFLQTV